MSGTKEEQTADLGKIPYGVSMEAAPSEAKSELVSLLPSLFWHELSYFSLTKSTSALLFLQHT